MTKTKERAKRGRYMPTSHTCVENFDRIEEIQRLGDECHDP